MSTGPRRRARLRPDVACAPVPDTHLNGTVGRVTGTVRPDHFGEVMLRVNGGVEAFYAKPYDGEETIAVGRDCVVIAYEPPRVLLVAALPDLN